MAAACCPLPYLHLGNSLQAAAAHFLGGAPRKARNGEQLRHEFFFSLLCTCYDVWIKRQAINRKACDQCRVQAGSPKQGKQPWQTANHGWHSSGVSEVAWELTEPKPNSKLFLLCICSEGLLRGTHNRISTFGVWDPSFHVLSTSVYKMLTLMVTFFFHQEMQHSSQSMHFQTILANHKWIFFQKCIARKCQNH